jgi:hypothetical protein
MMASLGWLPLAMGLNLFDMSRQQQTQPFPAVPLTEEMVMAALLKCGYTVDQIIEYFTRPQVKER